MALDINFLNGNLAQINYRSQAIKGQGGALRHFLFNGTPIMGNAETGLIIADYRRVGISPATEATFGADPNRVTYKTGFNSNALEPAYFNNREDIDFNNAIYRHWGEDISTDANLVTRIMTDLADKRDAMADAQNLAIEQMCAEVLFTGKVYVGVARDKEQAFPVNKNLLKVDGSKLISDPMGTLATAVKAVYKLNKSVRLRNLIMNQLDAMALIEGNEKWFDKNTFNQGDVNFKEFDEYGLVFDGILRIPGAGAINVYHYLADIDGYDLVPQGKALFVPQSLGAMGYGRVLSADNSVGIGLPSVAAERVTIDIVGDGDYKKLQLSRQTSPLPILLNVDGYCVLNDIPTV